MPVQKQVTAAQALALINRSEGNIVRDNKLRPASHDEPGAHSLGRHLVSAGKIRNSSSGQMEPSGPQAGAGFVTNRFMNSPDKVSSAWYKKGDMAIRLTEALNSAVGQEALKTMDNLRLNRIVIHYINKNIMTRSDGAFNPSHMSVDYTVTPESRSKQPVDIYNTKVSPPTFIKTIQKTVVTKASTAANVRDKDVVGIHIVLDKYPTDKLHLQTLFPSFELSDSSFEYGVYGVSWKHTYTGGRFVKKFTTS